MSNSHIALLYDFFNFYHFSTAVVKTEKKSCKNFYNFQFASVLPEKLSFNFCSTLGTFFTRCYKKIILLTSDVMVGKILILFYAFSIYFYGNWKKRRRRSQWRKPFHLKVSLRGALLLAYSRLFSLLHLHSADKECYWRELCKQIYKDENFLLFRIISQQKRKKSCK